MDKGSGSAERPDLHVVIEGGTSPPQGGPGIFFALTRRQGRVRDTSFLTPQQVKEELADNQDRITRIDFQNVVPGGWEALAEEVIFGDRMPKLEVLAFRGTCPSAVPVTINWTLERLKSLRFMSEEKLDLSWTGDLVSTALAVRSETMLDIHMTPLAENGDMVLPHGPGDRPHRFIFHVHRASTLRSDDALGAADSKTPVVALSPSPHDRTRVCITAYDHVSSRLGIDSAFCVAYVGALCKRFVQELGDLHGREDFLDLAIDIASIVRRKEKDGTVEVSGSAVDAVRACFENGGRPVRIDIRVPDEETGRLFLETTYSVSSEHAESVRVISFSSPTVSQYGARWLARYAHGATFVCDGHRPADFVVPEDHGIQAPMDRDDMDVEEEEEEGDDDDDSSTVQSVKRHKLKPGFAYRRGRRVGDAQQQAPAATPPPPPPPPTVAHWSDHGDDVDERSTVPHAARSWKSRTNSATFPWAPSSLELSERKIAAMSPDELRGRLPRPVVPLPPPSDASSSHRAPQGAPSKAGSRAPSKAESSAASSRLPPPPPPSKASSSSQRVVSAGEAARIIGPGSAGTTKTRSTIARARGLLGLAKGNGK